MNNAKQSAVSPHELKMLSQCRQPIYLTGSGRFVRRSVANAIHRDVIGMDMNLTEPHADLSVLVPPASFDPEDGKSIGIDAVRDFVERLSLTPYSSGYRIGFVEPGNALTPESQNALLRYIEEPTPTTRIIISSHRVEDIIPTLQSRCRIIRLSGGENSEEDIRGLGKEYDESEETVKYLCRILRDSDAVELILEQGLAQKCTHIYETVSTGRCVDVMNQDAFLSRRPAETYMMLFVEIVFAGVIDRVCVLESTRNQGVAVQKLTMIAQRILELQMELRYNPVRPMAMAAVLELLKGVEEETL